jgi:cytochrome P450
MVLILLAKLASALVAFLLARRVYWEATAGVQRRAFKRQHGCLSPKKRPARDPFWSLDLIRANINALRQHQVLQWWTEGLTSQNAHTLSNTMLENQVVQTDDPENIKSILATRFDGWHLEKARIKLIEKTLGRGIFSAEGAAWKHSRDMLRPCFERNQVADVSLLEKHTRRLLQLIPADDSTVDLKPLLCQLTLDVSTEFLFGTSTDSLLLAEQDSEPVRKFVKAFEYFLNPINNDNVKKFGWIGIFLPDPRIKREAKIIQGMSISLLSSSLPKLSLFCVP